MKTYILKLLKKVLTDLGIDGAIFYTSLSRVIQATGGIITVFLIARFMSPETQGFYFTFASVLAIQIFFELGFGGILNQFTAHEMAFLKFSSQTLLEGSETNLSRLRSLLHFCLKWYFLASLLFFLSLIAFGFWYFLKFGQQYSKVNWQLPWILVSVGASLNLFLSPWMAILQGMNKVKEMAKISLYRQIIILAITWMSLIMGAQLYISAINLMGSFIILLIFYLFTPYPKLLINSYKGKIKERINYKNEIFPLQWKIAISWISGFFIFQIFNPVIFAFNGAEAAGKIGMSITILNAITSFVISWTSTKIPTWSGFIAKKNFIMLDFSFKKTMKQSTIIALICVFAFDIFILVVNYFHLPIGNRFVSSTLIIILLSSIVFNNIINGFATYLRCHKKEPFLVQSIVIAFLTSLSTLLGAKYYGVSAVIIGYSLITIVISFPFSIILFRHYKVKYHS